MSRCCEGGFSGSLAFGREKVGWGSDLRVSEDMNTECSEAVFRDLSRLSEALHLSRGLMSLTVKRLLGMTSSSGPQIWCGGKIIRTLLGHEKLLNVYRILSWYDQSKTFRIVFDWDNRNMCEL